MKCSKCNGTNKIVKGVFTHVCDFCWGKEDLITTNRYMIRFI